MKILGLTWEATLAAVTLIGLFCPINLAVSTVLSIFILDLGIDLRTLMVR